MALLLVPAFVASDAAEAQARPWRGPAMYRPSPGHMNSGYRPVYPGGGPRFYGPTYSYGPTYGSPVYIPRPVYVPGRVVVRPIMVRSPQVVQPAYVQQPIQAEPQDRGSRDLIAVGIQGSAVGVSGQKVGLSTAENPAMGGLGVHVKGRFDRSWGLELSADFLSGSADGADLTQSTIPVMGALTWHILPDSRFQPYLLAGAGVHFTRLSYNGGDYAIDITEFAAQLGGGVEFFLTENIAIFADLRFNTVVKNLDENQSVHTDCLRQTGNLTGFCDNIHDANAKDKVNLGAQFKVGASWYF